MPTVKQIDPKHTPEKFFLKRDTGEVNPESKEKIYAYDLPNKEVIYAEGKAFQRKSENGVQDIHIYNNCYKIYEDDVLVAEAKVYPEIWDAVGKVWLREKSYKTTPTKIDGTLSQVPDSLESYYVDGLNTFGLQIKWQGGENQSGKALFEFEAPGETIRIVWVIDVKVPDNLVISWNDYKGNVESNVPEKDEHGDRHLEAATYEIIFEPKGVEDKLLVDPYLSVSEESGYIWVGCDGFGYRCYYGNNETTDYITDTSNSITYYFYVRIAQFVKEGVLNNALLFDLGSTLEIIENTPTRVVLRKVGQMEDTDQSVLADSGEVWATHYFYSDRIFIETSWVTTDVIEVDNLNIYQYWTSIDEYGNNLTSNANIYESGDSESTGGSGEVNTAKYIGITSDEMNVILINIAHSDNDDYVQTLRDTGQVSFGWNNDATFPAGTHTMTSVMIIDSAEREIRI